MSWYILIILFLLNYSVSDISAVRVTNNFRLPNNTKPHLYEIELDFDVFEKYFPVIGKSLIDFEVIEPTDTITLHKANNVKINEEYTQVEDQKIIVQQSWSSEELFRIKLSDYLTLGNYSLKLRWSVNNSDTNDIGFFAFYDNDQDKLVAGTRNLMPTYARKVFPCWDEPFYKSKFKFSVKHPKNLIALSNMPEIKRESDETDKILTRFEVSPRLSPHSIGITLTNFNFIKNQHGNLTFFTVEKNPHKIQHFFNITSKILSLLENYTKIEYPVPKLDVIILPQIPSELKNLGLMILNSEEINFPEVESELALYQYKKTEAIILAEALSLQWFGHLVTLSWWNDLWLAYGISNFVATEIIDQIFEYETIKAKNWLTIDAYKSYHALMILSPIRFASPRDIQKQLDSFHVSRYVQMVQMLEHTVTSQVFQIGLQKYLNKNKFSAVTTKDLWDSFEDNNNTLNLKKLMDPWLENPGYAVLEVSHDQKTNSIRLFQKNILNNYSNKTRMIPINFATKSNPNFLNTTPVFWMHQNEALISLSDPDDWIIFNVQQLDQYRVTYDEENWRRIINYLNTKDFNEIHPVNRAIIISELNQRTINDKNLKIILDLLPYLRHEKNLLPLYSAYNLIFKLSGQLTWPLVHSYSQLIVHILEPIIKNLEENYAVDNYLYKEAKSLKLLFMRIFCTLKRTDYCKNFAIQTVDYILIHPAEEMYLHNYHYSWTLCSVLKDYNESQWDNFFSNRYPLLKNNLYWKYTYLKCAKSATVVQKYFPKLLQDNIATSVNQFMTIFNFVMNYADEDKIQKMLDYFIDNFDFLQERFRNKLFNEVIYNMMTLFSVFIKSKTQWTELTEFIFMKRQELNNQYNVSVSSVMNNLHFFTLKQTKEFQKIFLINNHVF